MDTGGGGLAGGLINDTRNNAWFNCVRLHIVFVCDMYENGRRRDSLTSPIVTHTPVYTCVR